MRGNGLAISTPSTSRQSAVTSSSTAAKTSSWVTNDISRSICVNSGCRSRRRSSSRKDRKSTRLNSSHGYISYAVFCLKKKKKKYKVVSLRYIITVQRVIQDL